MSALTPQQDRALLELCRLGSATAHEAGTTVVTMRRIVRAGYALVSIADAPDTRANRNRSPVETFSPNNRGRLKIKEIGKTPRRFSS